MRRAATDVATVVVNHGGQRPDPRALPPAVRRRGVAIAVARGPVDVTSSRGVCAYSWRVRDGTRVSGRNVEQVSPARGGIGHGGSYTSKVNPFELR